MAGIEIAKGPKRDKLAPCPLPLVLSPIDLGHVLSIDIPLLVWHFIAKKQGRLGKTIERVPESVMRTLIEYDWPGNIRELENVVDHLDGGDNVASARATDAPCSADKNRSAKNRADQPTTGHQSCVDSRRAALQPCRWKIKGTDNAAERLGLKPSTLRHRMTTPGIQRPEKDKD
jgi:DNA-binding NtrC family response regulator